MSDYSLNPFVQNLGRPWENPTYDSSASYKKRWCKWCGCEGDVDHETRCGQKHQQKESENGRT
jgi:hypothetical protein